MDLPKSASGVLQLIGDYQASDDSAVIAILLVVVTRLDTGPICAFPSSLNFNQMTTTMDTMDKKNNCKSEIMK